MASARVLKFKRHATKLECSSCGVTVDGGCDCGAAYNVTPGRRAAVAVAATPQRSDRAIAAEIGVDHKTVASARRATGERSPVEPRTGSDGKKRRPPRRPEPVISRPADEVNAFQRELLTFLDDFTQRFSAWQESKPLLDSDGKGALMNALYLASDGLARLSQKLDNR